MPKASQLELFDPTPKRPNKRAARAAWVKATKEQFEIITLCATAAGGEWTAFSVPDVRRRLADYDPPAEPMEIFAKYCRLMSEGNMMVEDARTEFEAVSRTLNRLHHKDPTADTTHAINTRPAS